MLHMWERFWVGLNRVPSHLGLQWLALYTLSHRGLPVWLLEFWGTGKAQVTLTIGDVTNMRICD